MSQFNRNDFVLAAEALPPSKASMSHVAGAATRAKSSDILCNRSSRYLLPPRNDHITAVSPPPSPPNGWVSRPEPLPGPSVLDNGLTKCLVATELTRPLNELLDSCDQPGARDALLAHLEDCMEKDPTRVSVGSLDALSASKEVVFFIPEPIGFGKKNQKSTDARKKSLSKSLPIIVFRDYDEAMETMRDN